MIKKIGISRSKYYEWRRRMGIENSHNNKIPHNNWLTPEEKESILLYVRENSSRNAVFIRDGYRRITYQMMDKGIVAASPTTVFNLLKSYDLLNKWNTKKTNKKGSGYIQPTAPHQEWHIDIKYVISRGFYMFLQCVLDGYSRYIVHWELRIHMTEYDAEITIERAREKFPGVNPKIITDNGPQYTAKDFEQYLNEVGLRHVRISVGYPQSNGKIERFHRSIEEECLRIQSMVDLKDIRERIGKYIEDYNTNRLHSSLNYLTPEDYLLGRQKFKLQERERKMKDALLKRKSYWSQNNVG